MEYKEKYQEWIKDPIFDQKTKEELEAIKNNEEEIKERFYKDLEFGTGGLRGIIGAGTNRMNLYTVTKATQGLANYIKKQGGEKKGVAIAYDSRNMSPEFSEAAALCLNANGIKTYRFESLRPTPELSFAIRELKCISGIVITASHNPPEYNGYKAYWEDGAQVTAPRDKEIIDEVNAITNFGDVKTMNKNEAIEKGLYNTIGKEIDDRYMEEIKKLVLNKDIIKEVEKDIKIVYTPLHGTGNIPVQRILKELGFSNVYVVPEQEKPDGNFPTVSYPNPEAPEAFTLALKLAKEKDADIVLATDPDADRLGVYAKDSKTGEYVSFTGNMSAILIAEYRLSQLKERNQIPEKGAIVTTIVSTNMTKALANYYNIACIETLTGFKFIGEQIKKFEESNTYEYLFGFEESYGCLVGTHARDKDSIVAVMSLCEAAAYYKKQGLTLWDQMQNIYKKYGYYKETQISIVLKGLNGAEQIKKMMEVMRKNQPKKIGDYTVKSIGDYSIQKMHNNENGQDIDTNLPKSNVLYYDLDRNAWCCVRPSGTEPKIKFYIGVCGSNEEDANKQLNNLEGLIREMAEKSKQ